MKKFMLGLFVTTSLMLTGCSDDDDNGNVIGEGEESTTYNLTSATDNSTMGNATIQRNADNTTTVVVEMDDAMDANETRTVHLHNNSAAATGERVITLNEVDAATGTSTTTFTTFDDGSPVTYEQLLTYDGYIDVHTNGEEDYMAYSDIGVNELTGESRTYQLESANESGVDGTVTFERRVNNTTLATVNMNSTNESSNHPVRIFQDNAIDGDTPMLQLNNAAGVNGMSRTQIEMFDDETEVTYEDLMNYDGHIRVHNSNNDMNNDVAVGDIGQNELTGNVETYNLQSVGVSNVTGTVKMEERINGETKASIALDNTEAGVNHAATINAGVSGTEITVPARTLNTVNGATGRSATNISALDDGSPMDYNGLLGYDGHVNVFTGPEATPTSTIAAQADIGVNAL